MYPNHNSDKAVMSPDSEEVEKTHGAAAHETEAQLLERNETAMTRRILLKLDCRVLPVLALLFLCSFLDRTNVGNAKLYGLEKDLKITDYQYDQGLAVFYATYIFSEIPSNLVLKKMTPKVWLPVLTFLWGVVAMCLGFVSNFGSFVAVRALLGLVEGGLLPGMVLYLSTMYTRREMALRIGLFYTTASLSGAFGGLLARGLSEIGTRGGLSKWRWILVIEGLLTAVVAVLAYFLLPNAIATARFLTSEEVDLAQRRLLGSKPAGTVEDDNDVSGKESFKWSEVRRGILSLQTLLTASAYFGILAGLYSFGLFLPTIVKDLGYTANEAQLWSVIPYAVACVATVIIAFLSDRLQLRGTIMLCTLPIAIAGYAAIANLDSKDVRTKYGMTFLMATGLYSSVPPVLSWISNNSAGHYKRATTTAFQLAIANAGGFVAVFIYPSSQGPAYHKGHTIVMSLLVAGWFLIFSNVIYCRYMNKRKTDGKEEKWRGCGDDRDPEFRFVL